MRSILPLTLLPAMLAAESTGPGVIQGRVLDAQRRPLAGAQVRIQGPSSRTTTTDAMGGFLFLDWEWEATGFRLSRPRAGRPRSR